MAALFGEFLITLGLVKETVVLEALVAQAASGLTLCEAIHQGKLLPPQDQIKIFNYQAEHRVDYLQAAIATGFWNSGLESRAMELIHRHRKPLGHFLLSSGSINFDDLIKALDEYVVQNPAPPAPIPLRPEAVSVSSRFKFPVFAEDISNQYLQSFNRQQLAAYEVQLVNLPGQDKAASLAVFATIQEGCQRIRSTARLVRAEMTEALSNYLCEYFDENMPYLPGPDPMVVIKLLSECIRELSHLRDYVERDLSEKAYFEDQYRRQAVDNCCERVRPQSQRKKRTAS